MGKLTKVLGTVFVVLAIWFIYSTLSDNLDLIRSLDLGHFVPLLVITTLVGVVALLFRGHIWFLMLNHAGAKDIKWPKANYVFASTRLAQYIPGKVALLGIRIWYGKKFGLSLQTSSVVGIMDTLIPVGATLMVSTVFFVCYLILSGVIGLQVFILATALVGFMSVVGLVYVFPLIIRWILVRRGIQETPVILLSKVSKYFTSLGVFFILRGMSFALFLHVFTSVNIEGALLGGALFTGATFLSILSPFTPAGLGIVEGTLVAGLQIIFPIETALFIAAITRVWDVLLDLLFLCLSYIMKDYESK